MPPVLIAGAAVGVGLGIKAYADYKGNQAQGKAAGVAAGQAREDLGVGRAEATKAIDRGAREAYDSTTKYAALAQEALKAGNTRAAAVYQQKADEAKASLNQGYDAAQGRLAPLTGLSHYGEDALTGKGFETSGGYQFRLAQGNQALGRATSAAGGRLSGAALKSLSQYNQDFASNEYNNWAGRASHLGDVGYGAINASAGLDVSRGTGLADISGQTGAYLGNLAAGEGAGIANINQTTGTNLATISQNRGTGLANVNTGNAAANAQLDFTPVQYAGGGYRALGDIGGAVSSLGGAAAGYFLGGAGGGGAAPQPGGDYGAGYGGISQVGQVDANGNPINFQLRRGGY